MLFSQKDFHRFPPAAAAIVFLVASLVGCDNAGKITRYTVPKPELVDPTLVASRSPTVAVEQQILGAIIKTGEQAWFFKLTGDSSAVEPVRDAFASFVKSVQFSSAEDAKPSWTLPEGWKELPGNQFRFATLQLPQPAADGKPLEISVSAAGGDVLANVNRWRGQLNLKPVAADDLAKTSETIKIGDYDATLVRLVGTGSGTMASGPRPPLSAGGATPRATGERKQSSSTLAHEAPPHWTTGRLNEFRKASFTVAAGDKQAEITVIDLDPGSGDLLANVNRWREQVGLSPIAAAELASSVKKIDTLGVSGDYVELNGPGGIAPAKTILGVMAAAGGRNWFIKLTGDSELATREKPHFEAFVKSLKLK